MFIYRTEEADRITSGHTRPSLGRVFSASATWLGYSESAAKVSPRQTTASRSVDYPFTAITCDVMSHIANHLQRFGSPLLPAIGRESWRRPGLHAPHLQAARVRPSSPQADTLTDETPAAALTIGDLQLCGERHSLQICALKSAGGGETTEKKGGWGAGVGAGRDSYFLYSQQ